MVIAGPALDPDSAEWVRTPGSEREAASARLHALLVPIARSFPPMTVVLAGGESLDVPGALSGHDGVVVFYRGSWCPYCNVQLRAFERARDKLAELDVRVVALSVDDEQG